jgi:hypothetical protein
MGRRCLMWQVCVDVATMANLGLKNGVYLARFR